MSDSSTGQIVGAIVGGVVGFTLGGPGGAVQGASIGYGVGGAIDPPQGPLIRAPRLDDKTYQGASYGARIPDLYGTMTPPASIIYLENGEYKEVVKTQSQGKGGGGAETETVTYYATFAVQLGTASPGSVVRRLWLGGKLFYDNSGATELTYAPYGFDIDFNQSSAPLGSVLQSVTNGGWFKYYDGTQTEPDPRLEAVVGTADAESWTGTKYIMFYDLDLTDYGNGLPGCPVTAEIVSGSISTPELIDEHHFSEMVVDPDSGFTNIGPLIQRLSTVRCDAAVYFSDSANNIMRAKPTGYSGYGFRNSANISNTQYLRVGENFRPKGLNDVGVEASSITAIGYQPSDISSARCFTFQSRNGRWIFSGQNSGGVDRLWTLEMGEDSFGIAETVWCVAVDESADYYYIITDGSILKKIGPTGSTVSSYDVASVIGSRGFAENTFRLWHTGGNVYIAGDNCRREVMTKFWVFDDDLSDQIDYFTLPAVARSYPIGQSLPEVESFAEFIVENGILIRAWVETDYGASSTLHYERWNLKPANINPEYLDTIVESIAARAGIDSSMIDASALSSDIVFGYLAGGTSARADIGPLSAAYMFDIVEDGYTLKCVKRGSSYSEIIPYEALGAGSFGSRNDRLVINREMDSQLPSKYTVSYYDIDREYDQGSEYAEYPTATTNEQSLEVAIAMPADQAASIADILVRAAWAERVKVKFSLPQTYLHLKPADVVRITGPDRFYDVRIMSRSEEAGGVCTYNSNVVSSYVSKAKGALIDGGSQVKYISDADAVLMDIPMVIDSADTYGFPAIMHGDSGWPGGTLFRSIDNGQTFNSTQSFAGGSSRALANDTLPAHSCFTIDRVNTLNISVLSGSFSAITEDQMMTGQNWCAYGADGRWEIIRFAGATLEADGSYTLDTFVRGSKGTEWATGLHQANDDLVLLSGADVQFIGVDSARLGVTSKYKDVTFTQSATEVDSYDFTYRGVNLKPLSVVLISGGGIGDITITSTSRTRYSSSFWTSGVQPENESEISYECDILSGASAVRTISSTSPSFTYTSSQQIEDFGSEQTLIDVVIYQISSAVGRGYPAEKTISSFPSVYLETFDSLSNWTIGSGTYFYLAASPFGGNGLRAVNNGSSPTFQSYSPVSIGTKPRKINFDFKLVALGADDTTFFYLSSDTGGATRVFSFTAARQASVDASRRPYVEGTTSSYVGSALTIGSNYKVSISLDGSGNGSARVYNDSLTYDSSVSFSYNASVVAGYVVLSTQQLDSTGSVIYDNIQIFQE